MNYFPQEKSESSEVEKRAKGFQDTLSGMQEELRRDRRIMLRIGIIGVFVLLSIMVWLMMSV